MQIPTREKPSQVAALPPLVAPWQPTETFPFMPHHTPVPACPPQNKVSSASSIASEKEGDVEKSAAMRRESLECRLATLEQANLQGRPSGWKAVPVAGREGGEGGEMGSQEGLVRLSSEINARLERMERRMSVNERRILAEESRVTTLVKSTQEIERGILDGQRQLIARREEQGTHVEGMRERLHQLEQCQMQLGEFCRQAQDAFVMGVGRTRGEVDTVRSHMETMGGSIAGKLNSLEQGLTLLEESLLTVNTAVMGLEHASAQMKKQTDSRLSEVNTTLCDLHRQLVDLEREKKQQDAQLRESFMQVQAQMKRSTNRLQEIFTRQLQETSRNTMAESARLRDTVTSALQYSRRGCVEGRQSMRRELETRLTALEEVLESERKRCIARIDDLCSAVRLDCEKARDELATEIAATLQCGEQGREVLQGAVSVVEEEAKVSRQEISAVLEAEIKTRKQEACRLRSELQRLSHEWCSDQQALRSTLEAMQERAIADREQLQLVRDALASEWQEVGVRLLGDIDSRLSTVHKHIANLTHNITLQADSGEQGTDGEWKRKVSQQLRFVQQEQKDVSQQVATFNRALDELQIKLVRAVQRETNQRFHAVLELKNELSQLVVRMPLETQYTPSGGVPILPDPAHHHDSPDTSHDSQFTPNFPGHNTEYQARTPSSFYTEQGDDGEGGVERSEGRGGGSEGDEIGDHPYRYPELMDPPKHSHNPLHSKSHIVLSPQSPLHKQTGIGKLANIAESEVDPSVTPHLSDSEQQREQECDQETQSGSGFTNTEGGGGRRGGGEQRGQGKGEETGANSVESNFHSELAAGENDDKLKDSYSLSPTGDMQCATGQSFKEEAEEDGRGEEEGEGEEVTEGEAEESEEEEEADRAKVVWSIGEEN